MKWLIENPTARAVVAKLLLPAATVVVVGGLVALGADPAAVCRAAGVRPSASSLSTPLPLPPSSSLPASDR